MCKYIAYRWAKEELYGEFDNIVYIALREWKEDGLESIIKKLYFQEQHKDEAIEIDPFKTLFLFDGYDELSETSLLHSAIEKYHLQNYIITSRPYGYRKSDFDVNEVFETIGFTDENVTAYIDKFFQEQSHKNNLQNFLRQNINIKHIAYIPLMLEMICSLWREKIKSHQSFLSPMTMTEIYSEVIEYIFSEYSETNNTAYIQEREDEIFNYLGKIAFEGLKRQVIVLDKSIIEEKKEFFIDYVLKTGFLRSNRKHRNPLMNSYQFPHLTFQEYFAALYVSRLSKKEISEVIREYKFYPYMQVFFAFLGGLIEDKEFFLREIDSEPRDLVGLYEFHLMLNCIGEIQEIIKYRTKLIYKKFFQWLRYFMLQELYKNEKLLLDKTIFISHIVDSDFIYLLTTIMKDDQYYPVYRTAIVDALVHLEKDDRVLNIVIEQQIIEDKRLGTDYLKYLFSFYKKNNKFINYLMELFKDDNVNENIKETIVQCFASIETPDNIIELLINTLNNKNINYRTKSVIALYIIPFMRKKHDKFLKTIIKVFQKKDTTFFLKTVIGEALFSIPRKDYKLLNTLDEIMKDKKVEEFLNKDIFGNSRDIRNNKKDIEGYLKRDFFGKIRENQKEDYSEIYLLNKNPFENFNTHNILDKLIIENIIPDNLPIYIRNNKLCTIYENKEIKSKRNVRIEDIEKVKKEIGLILTKIIFYKL